MNTCLILGASDPEMAAIRRLAISRGYAAVQAAVGGKPVHPGNAYAADSTVEKVEFASDHVVFVVECGGPLVERIASTGARVLVIDHHRVGDYGYGRPPAEFLPASSVGQFLKADAELRTGAEVRWSSALPWALEVSDGSREEIPEELVLTAAADHCLPAAYRGECPGVDPDRLMRWRAESRAAFQRRPVEDLLADVGAARRLLRERFNGILADLRGLQVPELPEAAAREGIPFLAEMPEKDGRVKVVLQSAPPELVREFMAGTLVPGLTGIYGDPARGFAGGYK